MKAVSGKRLSRLLEAKGWALLRTSGSHRIYAKQGHKARISLPVHGNSPLKIGLQRFLMSIAGIDESEL